jgi:hypothetical protein
MASHCVFQCYIGAKRSPLMKCPIVFLDSAVATLKSGGDVVAAELLFLAIEINSQIVASRMGRRRIPSAGF